ncbi:MAG: hypothetical protein D6812_11650 [Deltaproteobacteria bacterium]|nr:MAG: hypothetical protein D6812_11650 [Deltaproteobacteria bacterium]
MRWTSTMQRRSLAILVSLLLLVLCAPGGCQDAPPTVEIIEPGDFENFPEGAVVHVIADCTDDKALSEVFFAVIAEYPGNVTQTLVDDMVRVVPKEPFYRLSFNFRTPTGYQQIEIRVTAVDDMGQSGEDIVTIR